MCVIIITDPSKIEIDLKLLGINTTRKSKKSKKEDITSVELSNLSKYALPLTDS